MKKKNYTKLGVWLTFVGLIFTFSALNPVKAKRIACKIAVFFEIFENQKTCEIGCPQVNPKNSKTKKPKPKNKKSSKSKTHRICDPGKTLSVASIYNTNNFLSFAIIHLALFFIFKVATHILKPFFRNS